MFDDFSHFLNLLPKYHNRCQNFTVTKFHGNVQYKRVKIGYAVFVTFDDSFGW